MSWSDPRTWFSSAPAAPAPLAPAPPTTLPYGARRRTRRGRKGSKRVRTGKRSNRA